MGLNTSLHVGFYIEAKMATIPDVEAKFVCEKNPNHKTDPYGRDEFCSKCGGKIIKVEVPATSFRSFSNIQFNTYAELQKHYPSEVGLAIDDYEWARDALQHVPSEWVGHDKEGHELLVFEKYNTNIDADYEGVHDLPSPATGPSRQEVTDTLNRIQKIMGYESVEMKYGVLVSVA